MDDGFDLKILLGVLINYPNGVILVVSILHVLYPVILLMK